MCKHLKHQFPRQVSYNHFVELEKEILLPLTIFIKKVLMGTCIGISFVDSTPLRVCRNQRFLIHKSSNYIGDLIKKTTGDTANNYIRQYIVQEAKNQLASGTGVAQVAYSLGFEYSQHLSRMFKKQTGMTPSEYCLSIQNKK